MEACQRTTAQLHHRLGEPRARLEAIAGRLRTLMGDPRPAQVIQEASRLGQEVRRLEAVEAYLEAAIRVETAREALSTGQVDDGVIRALKDLKAVQGSCPFGSLVARAKAIEETVGRALEVRIQGALREALEALEWPKAVDPADWDSPAVTALLKAASDQLRFDGGDNNRLVDRLVEPIAVRFAFHFRTAGKPTSRLDRPEWALAHLLNQASCHAELLGGLLEEALGAAGLFEAFLRRLVWLAREHLEQAKAESTDKPLLLAHAISETIRFHKDLWETHGFDDGQSCLRLFMQDPECREAWLSSQAEALLGAFEGLREADPVAQTEETIGLFNAATDLYQDVEEVGVRLEAFRRWQVPLLEALLQGLEFALPAFHSTQEDLEEAIGVANAAQRLLGQFKQDWANRLVFLEMIGEDGDPFGKTMEAFGALLHEQALERILANLLDQFKQPASIYARAMHYGVTVSEGCEVPVHPELQASLSALSQAIASLGNLDASLKTIVERRMVQAIGDFFFTKVVLRNYFHSAGTLAFGRDLAMVIRHLSACLPNTAEAVEREAFIKAQEALALLEIPARRLPGLPEELATAEDLQAALQQDDFGTASAILRSLAISALGLAEVAEILTLRK